MSHRLRAIDGGARSLRLGHVLVRAAPSFRSPFPVDAIVREEDTFEVLSTEPEVQLPLPHPLRVIHEANTVQPARVGSVVSRGGWPLRLHAIVHDLSAAPTCRAEWVEAALAEVVAACERRRLAALALPLLGTQHGRLSRQAVTGLLRQALLAAGEYPARVWVLVAAGSEGDVLDDLGGSA